MENLAIIYLIRNSVNDMIYVGSTTQTIEKRWKNHVKHAREGRKSGLLEDIREFGEEKFSVEEIDSCFVRHRFVLEEYHWYKMHEEGVLLYDIKRGASHSRNTRQKLARARQSNGFDYSSDDFKDKMSKATRGKNNGMYGKKDDQALNGRIVIASDKQGNVVHTFPSVKLALAFIGIKGHSKLNEACRTGIEYKGFFWKKEWINR